VWRWFRLRAFGWLSEGLRGLWLLWLIAAGVVVVGSILWAAVVEPSWLLPNTRGLSPADRVKAQTDFRSTLVTMLGGLAVLVGAVVAGLTLRETSRQNRAVLELQRRGQVTERFTRAIDQLGQRGDEKLDVRIGAVYALEQIASDSAELHWPIMEVLTAYLREHAPARPPAQEQVSHRMALGISFPPAPPPPLPADQQAIATVIGRRRRKQDPEGQCLDLFRTNLPRVQWSRAHLEGANLSEANLEGADLSGARLEGARLAVAFLQGATLNEANLKETFLVWAYLKGADLSEAQGLSWEQIKTTFEWERAHLPADLVLAAALYEDDPADDGSAEW
jgi:hypothetical protein